MDPFAIVPLFITVVFVIVFVTIASSIVAGLLEWSRNNSLPIQELPARVVTKRAETRGRSYQHSHGRVSTFYFATFELKGGDRSEFSISGPEYGLLAEGDEGTLTYQGTRYHGFQRRV
ncbi:MAG: DUF2500 domain-containing protein [Paludisphaera borealis]|uniref:DUF2500 domain-containing protein n=1 Tax=Paludisphaera borealis TaxID=1387353 RepID=UPI002848023B|nr:DUF2500 domain-containing protein [Paludisphaera borealis]MDR3621665.1 DUF2500 domain-containing protein [Paludisphaera borealis]